MATKKSTTTKKTDVEITVDGKPAEIEVKEKKSSSVKKYTPEQVESLIIDIQKILKERSDNTELLKSYITYRKELIGKMKEEAKTGKELLDIIATIDINTERYNWKLRNMVEIFVSKIKDLFN